jgi:hypothetical protein
MLTLLKSLLYDEDKFRALAGMAWLGLRGGLVGLAVAVSGGQVDLGPTAWWIAPILAAMAGGISRGEAKPGAGAGVGAGA